VVQEIKGKSLDIQWSMSAPTHTWIDSPEYVAGFREHIAPLQGTPFYSNLEFSYTDTARFDFFIEPVLRYASLTDKTVLDSGCGAGGLCIRLQLYYPRHVTAVELDPVQSRLAVQRLAALPNVTVVNSDAEQSGLPAASLDVVFSLHVIEHVPNANLYLDEIVRLLRPGGLLLLACPHRLWPLEAHTGLPLIHYLPRGPAKLLAHWLSRRKSISPNLAQRLETSTLYQHDFTYFRVHRMLKQAGLEILELNHPRFLLNGLERRGWRRTARLTASLPARPQTYLTGLPLKNIMAVCRKP